MSGSGSWEQCQVGCWTRERSFLKTCINSLSTYKSEAEAKKGCSLSAGLKEYQTHTSEAELQQEIKQDNRSLKKQKDELNDQIINLSVQGALTSWQLKSTLRPWADSTDATCGWMCIFAWNDSDWFQFRTVSGFSVAVSQSPLAICFFFSSSAPSEG
eukprot:superscaffoldBa00005200_g20035